MVVTSEALKTETWPDHGTDIVDKCLPEPFLLSYTVFVF